MILVKLNKKNIAEKANQLNLMLGRASALLFSWSLRGGLRPPTKTIYSCNMDRKKNLTNMRVKLSNKNKK